MAYAQRLIKRILEAERVRGGSLADGKTYRDEPILRTEADLARQGTRTAGRQKRRYAENDAAQLEFLRALKDDPAYNRPPRAKKAPAKRPKTARPESKAAAPAPQLIEVDLGQLAGIRAAAARSCEALLTEEERFGTATAAAAQEARKPEPVGVTPESPAEPLPSEPARAVETAAPAAAPVEAGQDSPFSPAEAAFIRCLIGHASAAERAQALAQAGVPESMLVDAINEKALDLIGDVAVESGGRGPEIVEDYIEDLRGLVA